MSEGLKKIIGKIEEKAKGEAESVLEDAKKESEEITEEAEKKAKQEKEKIREKGMKEAKKQKQRILSNARRDTRQKKLGVREEFIDEVFEKTEKRLENLRGNEEYESILKDLIIDGGITVGGEDIDVLVLEGDEKKISAEDKKEMENEISDETGKDTELTLESELEDAKGGTIVKKSDGSVSCNNTFSKRLSRKRDSIRPKIAEILFEE